MRPVYLHQGTDITKKSIFLSPNVTIMSRLWVVRWRHLNPASSDVQNILYIECVLLNSGALCIGANPQAKNLPAKTQKRANFGFFALSVLWFNSHFTIKEY